MGTIITRSDKEVLHFFDEMKRVSDLIDHLPAVQHTKIKTYVIVLNAFPFT